MEKPASSSESAMPSASTLSDVFQPWKNSLPKRAKPPVCITADPSPTRPANVAPLRHMGGTGTIALFPPHPGKTAPMLSPLTSAQTRSVADVIAAGHFGPAALKRRADEVRQHYDDVSATRGDYIAKNPYYYEQVYRLLRFLIPPGK